MGMFDNIRCHYPLPLAAAQELEFQTKDTPEQFLMNYEIRPDGSLWLEDCDYEDQSDPNAEGLARSIGSMARINERWIAQPDFTGEIVFYGDLESAKDSDKKESVWVEFSAYFRNGQLQQLNQLKSRWPAADGNP